MSGKKVGILIKRSPLTETEAVEALRMAVGQTLRTGDVCVFLVDKASETFSRWGTPEFRNAGAGRHLDALIDMGLTVVLEKESIDALGEFEHEEGIEVWKKNNINRFLSECDVAIVV